MGVKEKRTEDGIPNISGSFQVVSETQQNALKDVAENHDLDEKSLYYARIFMED